MHQNGAWACFVEIWLRKWLVSYSSSILIVQTELPLCNIQEARRILRKLEQILSAVECSVCLYSLTLPPTSLLSEYQWFTRCPREIWLLQAQFISVEAGTAFGCEFFDQFVQMTMVARWISLSFSIPSDTLQTDCRQAIYIACRSGYR